MGARGKYAGQPISFECAKCRKRRFAKRRQPNIELTGKSRKQYSAGMNYHNWPDIAHQYRCLDCGHVGWSRHPDVARRAATK